MNRTYYAWYDSQTRRVEVRSSLASANGDYVTLRAANIRDACIQARKVLGREAAFDAIADHDLDLARNVAGAD